MSIDVNALRTQLQYSCDELRNLTNSDLAECKWNTKKTIFQALLGSSNVCRDENDLIYALSESRNKELSDFRVKNASRDIKADAERSYRTNFYRILLQALQRLRWPPTLEAFSDPLSDLINDNSLVLSAMFHILKCGLQKSNTELEDIDAIYNNNNNNNNNYNNSSHRGSPGFSRPKSSDDASSGLGNSNNSSNINSDNSYSSNTSKIKSPGTKASGLLKKRVDIIAGVDSYLQNSSFSHMLNESDSAIDSGSDSSVSSSASSLRLGLSGMNNNSRIGEESDPHTGRSFVGTGPPDTGRSGISNASESRRGVDKSSSNAHLVKIIEVLQHQNETLSQQLYRLQRSVMARGETELKIEAILLDFKALTEEAAVVTHKGSKGEKVGPGELNSLEREEFEAEVSQEIARTGAKKLQKDDKTGGTSSFKSNAEKDNNSNSNSNSNSNKDNSDSSIKTLDYTGISNNKVVKPSIHSDFKKMKSQAKSTLELWRAAIHESRSSVEAMLPLHTSTKDYFKVLPGTHNPALGSFQGSFQGGGQKSSSSPRFDHHSEFKRPIDIKTYEVFGLSSIWGVPRPESGFSAGNSGEEDRHPAGVFDLRKVHSLQRSLVQFSEQVTLALQELEAANASVNQQNNHQHQYQNQHSPAGQGFKHGRLEGLQLESQKLALQLACVAPLSPLSAESSVSSNISGLDALILEVKAMDKNSKHSNSTKIQKIIDRAKSEEQSLIRSYTKCRDYLTKWPQASLATEQTISRISQRFKALLDKQIAQVQASCKSINMMVSSWTEADRSKIPLDQVLNVLSSLITPGASSKHLIAPMEKINQGLLGDPLAKFVQTMRICLDDIDQLKAVADQFGAKIKEFGDLEGANMRELQAALRYASEQTVDAIVSSRSSSGVMRQIRGEEGEGRQEGGEGEGRKALGTTSAKTAKKKGGVSRNDINSSNNNNNNKSSNNNYNINTP